MRLIVGFFISTVYLVLHFYFCFYHCKNTVWIHSISLRVALTSFLWFLYHFVVVVVHVAFSFFVVLIALLLLLVVVVLVRVIIALCFWGYQQHQENSYRWRITQQQNYFLNKVCCLNNNSNGLSTTTTTNQTVCSRINAMLGTTITTTTNTTNEIASSRSWRCRCSSSSRGGNIRTWRSLWDRSTRRSVTRSFSIGEEVCSIIPLKTNNSKQHLTYL